MRVQRGDVFWAHPGPHVGTEQGGRRPYLVLSHEVFNESYGAVIAMALTSRPPRRSFPLAIPLESENLPRKSWVKVGQVRTLSLQRLESRLGRIDELDVNRVSMALLRIVGP